MRQLGMEEGPYRRVSNSRDSPAGFCHLDVIFVFLGVVLVYKLGVHARSSVVSDIKPSL